MSDTTVLDLFLQQVEKSPRAIALCFNEERLTYSKLDELSSVLAIELVAKKIQPGDLVALFLPRSIEQIIAMIAVMKCGAAYVPIDTEHTSERFSVILNEAKPSLVLTDKAGEERIKPYSFSCYLINKECLVQNIKESVRFESCTVITNDSLAYVIYTSGSSGTPKGVQISHRNLFSLFQATQPYFFFSAKDVWTAFHSFAFDFSVWEVWGALAFGGRLILVPSLLARQPDEFFSLLLREQVTVLNQTPTAFYGLMDAFKSHWQQKDQLALRLVIFGGEALDVNKVCQFASGLGSKQTQYVNMYGITETTVHATYYPLPIHTHSVTTSVIGKALPHLTIRLLDSALREITKPGEMGELYLSGDGVAQGYLNRPDLTAERFVADPHGVRMYRSGDLACYNNEGLLEYIGREDQQVKIRGYRIELNEIEAVLDKHKLINKSVVLYKKDQNGDPCLVAFFTLKNKHNKIDLTELRQFLHQALPSYMQPSQLHAIDAFPTTTNGKIDQKFLLTSIEVDMISSENSASIENPLEQFVISVWSKVLGVKDIGPNDDYFDLGGQSLNAITVVKELGITMVELFNEPTPRAIAKIILNNIQNKKDTKPHEWLHQLTNHKSTDQRLSLVCVPYGGGGPLVYKELAGSMMDLNVFSVVLPGHDPLKPEELVPFEESVTQCVRSIKNQINGPIAIYGHCAGNALAIEIARRLEQSGIELVAIHIGAMLRNKNPENVIKQVQSNTVQDVVDFLKSIGGLDGALRDDHLENLIKVFKHDSMHAAQFFLAQEESTRKINAPMHIIVGDDDPLTKGYQTNYMDWNKFSNHLTLSVVPNGRHHFVKYQARELAQLIRHFHKERCEILEHEVA